MTASTDELATLIHRKLQVLRQLHAVGLRQADLVDSGDTANLLRLLSAKQQLVDALGQIERAMAPFRDQAPEDRTWSSPQKRALAASESQECARLLAEIVAMEEQQEARMRSRRDDVGQQLRQAHCAAGAAGAYRAHHTAGPPRPVAAEDASGAARLDLSS
ncbi:FlgN protein [Pirellulimonas nuda]|uniref:Flagellar protein FliT n=1 Tax=Pirellulimonas nuda TaxID=2528009 RepID=A0A518D9S6_9BACT|nr:hypothetical protein [Pirellulimonas nuda]QDU88240.1 FlgN protein [Pirellulimonas nuda]